MSAPQFTKGPWYALDIGEIVPSDSDGYPLDDTRICFMATPGEAGEEAQRRIDANACLIAAAPDYAEACGLTLDPGENETCGPLSWLRTALDTLKEDAVQQAASGDDPDAYWMMCNEVETLIARLTAASTKARGDQ